MRLYHFTSPERLTMIRLEGEIRVTESNIGSPHPDWPPCGEHVGPDVVWLTDVDTIGNGAGLALDGSLDGTDKTAVRIEVDVPDADVTWWPDFARAHGMHRNWRRVIERGRDPESWFVVARAIPRREWVKVDAPGGGEGLRLPGL